MKKKILFIITDVGSFNNFLAELSIFLSSTLEFEIHVVSSPSKVISINDKYDYQKYNIIFHYVDIPRGFNLLKQIYASGKIHRIIKVVKPDLIHTHFTTGTFTTLLYKKPKEQVWGTFHGLGFTVTSGIKGILFSLIERFCFNRLDKIFVLNEADYQRIENEYKNKVYKYNSLGLGCDIKKFALLNFTSLSKENLKKELHISNQKVLTFMGRFTAFKGFHIVVKTFLKLADEAPGAYKLLLIGGKDPIHDTGLTGIEENKMYKHSDIITIRYTDQVPEYLSITDIFIFPSKKEGIPVCILEALSMEVPVITFDSRGCNEVIENEYNGLLVDDDLTDHQSIISIAKKVEDISLNKKLLSVIKDNVKRDRHKYDRENFIKEEAERYIQFFKNK